ASGVNSLDPGALTLWTVQPLLALALQRVLRICRLHFCFSELCSLERSYQHE
ncbi:hypothetical protein HHI36_004614, partial [Cryptolaemus montrouzieri]